MRLPFILLCLGIVSLGCDRLNAIKYTKYDGSSTNLYLDRESIRRDLEPIISTCSQDSDCKLGELPTLPSCSTVNGVEQGAYLVSKEAEFNLLKSEIDAAVTFVRENRRHFQTELCAPDDPIVTLNKAADSPVAVCRESFCQVKSSSVADFDEAVGLSLLSDDNQSRASLSVIDGRYDLRYRVMPEGTSLDLDEFGWRFQNSSGSQTTSLHGVLDSAEVSPLKDIAERVIACEYKTFSYNNLGYYLGRPAIYCGSYSLGLNDLRFDRRELFSHEPCDASSSEAAGALAVALKALIASKVGTLSTQDQEALDELGAWEAGPSTACGAL